MKHVELSNFYMELEDRRNEKPNEETKTNRRTWACCNSRPSQKETSIPTIDFQVLC